MDRRKLVQRGLGLAAGALPVGPLIQAAKIFGDRRQVSPEMLDLSEQLATQLAVTYLTTPGGEAVPAALAHARSLAKLLTSARMSDTTKRRLAAIASDAAALVRLTYINDGQIAQARQWYADALALAREAGDRRLEAHALAAPESIPGRPGGKERLEAIQAAANLDGHLPAAGRAHVNGYLSWELALAADDAGSGRALERGLGAASRIDRQDPGWGCYSQPAQLSGWDGARAQVFAGMRLLYLGRYREAVPILEGGLDGTVVPGRRAALHTDLMRAWTGVKDPERACAEGMAALDETQTRDLGGVSGEVRDVRATFPPSWSVLACVVELDERLANA